MNNDEQVVDYPKQVENTPRIKVCSFEGMQTEGNVELHILKPNRFNHPRLSFRSYMDSEGTYWGLVSRVDKEGNVEYEQITLDGDVIRFNLNNIREAKRWHIVKHSPFVHGSKRALETGGIDVAYKIFDINVEADNKVANIRKGVTAIEWIESLDGETLTGLARVYGLSPETNSPKVILQLLLEKAQKHPESIIAKRDNMSQTQLLITLKRAVATQVVKEIPGIGYKYENVTLGVNDNTAAEYLRSHPDIALAINQFSKEKERSGTIKKDISGGAQPPRERKSWQPKQPVKNEDENFE